MHFFRVRSYAHGMAKIETYARPITIYRYRPLSRSKAHNPRADEKLIEQEFEPLEQKYIYCSTYRQLNDPMEGFFNASQRVQAREDYNDTVDLIRTQKLGLGIASFSETWDNELMWAHYGGAFAGICIGYSVTKLLDGLPEDHALARVAYGDRPYYLGLGALRLEHRARAILSTKNLKWSYEREWRLFAPASGAAHHNSAAVTCVYLGPRMSKVDQERIRQRLQPLGIEVRLTTVKGYSISQAL